MRNLVLFLLAVQFIGCASKYKQNVYTTMAVSAVVAGLIGSSNAPDGENKTAHAALWAFGASSIGAITAIEYFDEDQSRSSEIEKMNKQIQILKHSQPPSRRVMSSGASLFSQQLPAEAKEFITPGEWRKYEIDEWFQDQGNLQVWYHKDKMYEFIPPRVKN